MAKRKTQRERSLWLIVALAGIAWTVAALCVHGNDKPSTLGVMPFAAFIVVTTGAVFGALFALDKATAVDAVDPQAEASDE